MAFNLQSFLRDVAGGFFGNDYLRDYTHASKTFRTNLYQNSPKLKFLFHVYFDINPEVYPVGLNTGVNFGLYVKDVKLPSYGFNTLQLNQYNRKRIVQTKIKYDPVSITFHDDNANNITRMWNAYYTYYYKDGTKPTVVFNGAKGSAAGTQNAGGGVQAAQTGAAYNTRTTYLNSITGDDDWGYIGETSQPNPDAAPTKTPFFKNITIFSFYQHRWTAYTLINPIITSFAHDTHSYGDNAGIMQNSMSLDYETVVYNYGALDGNAPSDIVTGFGLETNYDRKLSPIARPGSNSNIFGPQGALDTLGGFLDNVAQGKVSLNDIKNVASWWNNNGKNLNVQQSLAAEFEAMLRKQLQQNPKGSPMSSPTRNTMFTFPVPGATPNTLGTAGAPPINALVQPPRISKEPIAGTQVNTIGKTPNGG